jgi:hypothetical protein
MKNYSIFIITILISIPFYGNNLNENYLGIFQNIPGPNCSFSVTPDLLLIASSAQIENEINQIYNKFSDDYLGISAPTNSQLNNAISTYNTYNITVNAGVISGNTINNLGDLDFLRVFARQLKSNPSDADIQDKANKIVWLASKQICDGVLDEDVRGYDYRTFGRAAIFLKDFLTTQVQDLFANTLYLTTEGFLHYWVANYDVTHQQANDAIDTDIVYNKANILMAYSLWQETPEERYRYMRAFKRYMERFFSYSVGTTNGIKNDGSGFHHWTAYNNYMYSYNTAMNCVSYLDGTSFQVSTANYKIFRDAVLVQLLQANDAGVQALSTVGRKPAARQYTLSASNIQSLAIAGGNILGLATADPILAGFCNRAFGVNPQFNYNTVAPFETGFIQLNHASAGIFRNNNWVAIAKGFSNGLWGTETYNTSNRYGRYQSYGALEILYPGSIEFGNGYNETTWDWNYSPGTTVINLLWDKLHAERERIDERQEKNFVGSLTFVKKEFDYLSETYGDYGMFAMDFQEMENQGFGTTYSSNNHNGSFTFKKSNFFFDDIIVCLGSGISNNDTSNKTITTLYQRLDNKGVSPIINGANQSSIGEFNYSGNSNNWIVDNYNTGFYLLPNTGNSIKLKKSVQQTPNHNQIWPATISGNPTATYYVGYIDHGLNPSNKSYEYILKPNTTSTEMQNLNTAISGGNKPYTVHQQDATAHIIEHKTKGVFGYAVFTSINDLNFNEVKNINTPCLLLSQYNTPTNELRLAISNPDLGIASRSYDPIADKIIDVTLHGEWSLIDSNPNVQLISANATETLLRFTTKDGLSLEVKLSLESLSVDDLKKKESGIKIYPNPTKNLLNISSEKQLNSIELYSILGQKINTIYNTNGNNKLQLNTSALNNGIYLVKIKTETVTMTKKIIIKK